jgi:membrane protein implicated in regulation of membrane protease activity
MFVLYDTEELFSQAIDGVVEQCEENLLRVRALGSIWNAIARTKHNDKHFTCGQLVRVIGRKGIKLIIE